MKNNVLCRENSSHGTDTMNGICNQIFVYMLPMNSCFMRRQNNEKYERYLMQDAKRIKTESLEDANEIYVWTCAFRTDAKENSQQTVIELAKRYPEKQIFVCGCMPDIAKKERSIYSTYQNIKVIPWKKENEIFQTDLSAYDDVLVERPLCRNIDEYKRQNPDKPAAFPDQFIKANISEGCNCDCAYCSEKLAFPPFRSFPIDSIVSKCKSLIGENGYDIMLLADSLGEYGKDLPHTDLTILMNALYKLDPRVRIALNNLHPMFFLKFSDYFVQRIKEGRIRHINIPIQSASTPVLERMRRNYTGADVERIFSTFNHLGFKEYDTHLLVGFHGETENNFMETVNFICRHKPKYVLASCFMETPEGSIGFQPEERVMQAEKERRITLLAERFVEAGIIVNCDGSELSKKRWNVLSGGLCNGGRKL